MQISYENFDLFQGYETYIGVNDVKATGGVSFHVKRTSAYLSTGTVIPYQREITNIGGGMNLATGIFTAPTNGRYSFMFNGVSYSSSGFKIYLRLNNVQIAVAHGEGMYIYQTDAISATLSLKKGDRVDSFLFSGKLYDADPYRYTDFTGFLLEEDLVL